MISFSCAGCGKAFTVPDDLAGRRSRCKACGAPLTIPASGPTLPPRAPRPVETKSPRRRRRQRPRLFDREAGIALAIGAALAGVALAVPLVGFVLHVLITVIHELGHVATAWVLASPALPSFDLAYGGGVSLILPRQPLLVLAGCGGFALALWRARGDRPALARWAVAAALYGVAVFTPLRGPLIAASGHGSELVFAGIFLYRALSGNQLLRREERPLYAALGFFLLASDARFAADLVTSAAHREAYGDAKGGGHWMDFDLIATDLGWSLPGVARLFLLACALTPIVAGLAHLRAARR